MCIRDSINGLSAVIVPTIQVQSSRTYATDDLLSAVYGNIPEIATGRFPARNGQEVSSFIDKVITIGKKPDLNNKKSLFTKLQDKNSVRIVFDTLSKRYANRKGGYSRVLKAGFRTGDDAPMAVIELVDRNPEAKKVDKPKKTETKDKKKEIQPDPKVASK